MGKIKLQNGNPILKDGKLSCECCEILCPGYDPYTTSRDNIYILSKNPEFPNCATTTGVFLNEPFRCENLNKEMYEKIYRGGTFLFEINASRSQSAIQNEKNVTQDTTANGSVSFLKRPSECQQIWSGSFPSGSYAASYGDEQNGPISNNIFYSIALSLKKEAEEYILFYSFNISTVAEGWISTTCIEGIDEEIYEQNETPLPVINSSPVSLIVGESSISLSAFDIGSGSPFGSNLSILPGYSDSFSMNAKLTLTPY